MNTSHPEAVGSTETEPKSNPLPSFNPQAMLMTLSENANLSTNPSDKPGNDERFCFILTEVLRLRTQVSSLQAQIAAITHERDNTSMLMWTEVSRLAQQLEQLNPNGPMDKRHSACFVPDAVPFDE